MHIFTLLADLNSAFMSKGHSLRLVGGAVRDHMQGFTPKDFDFCTDALPHEQKAMYEEYGIKYLPTGEEHGTFTVIVNGVGYEITSLRSESQHDGRYAVMTFGRDWEADAARRDLTINAISMDFAGKVYDPFGGIDDLKAGIVRFVGNPVERMTEDHLRILRWFRFLGRANGIAIPSIAEDHRLAVEKCAPDLIHVSAERVWAEMRRIVVHQSGPWVVALMDMLGVSDAIRMPVLSQVAHQAAISRTQNPALVIAASASGKTNVGALPFNMKWSRSDISLVRMFADYREKQAVDLEEAVMVGKANIDHAIEVASVMGWDALCDFLKGECPVFPVTGNDLLARGMKGVELGTTLQELRTKWFNSRYTLTAGELLA